MANQSANTIADAAAMNKEERGERAQSPPSTSEPLLIAGSFWYLSLWQVPGCSLKPRPIRNVATLARAASSSGARAAPGAEACAAGNPITFHPNGTLAFCKLESEQGWETTSRQGMGCAMST